MDNNLTIADLEETLAKIEGQRDALKEKARAIVKALDAKRAEAAAREKLAAMSDLERAAMAQIVKPQGIDSGEAFGG